MSSKHVQVRNLIPSDPESGVVPIGRKDAQGHLAFQVAFANATGALARLYAFCWSTTEESCEEAGRCLADAIFAVAQIHMGARAEMASNYLKEIRVAGADLRRIAAVGTATSARDCRATLLVLHEASDDLARLVEEGVSLQQEAV